MLPKNSKMSDEDVQAVEERNDETQLENDSSEGIRRRAPVTEDSSSPETSTSKPNDTNNNNDAGQNLPYKNSEEYAKALNQWMVQCYWWQVFNNASGPLYASAAALSGQQTQSNPLNVGSLPGLAFVPQMGAVPNQRLPPQQQANADDARVYVLPKIWKRVAAELIDFLFLLVLKAMVTYVAIDYFDLVDLEKYEMNLLEVDFDAYQFAYELTSEILIIEIIHRVLVIAFETFCLAKSQAGGHRVGGATPGKTLMGLKVVSCTRVDELGNGTIRVVPAGDLGVLWALLRACIKNLSAVFFLPAALTIFVSNHHRTAYDIACHCIVVEDIPINLQRRRPG